MGDVRRGLAEVDSRLPVLRVSTLAENVSLILNQGNGSRAVLRIGCARAELPRA